MSYLTLPEGIADFSKAVVSLWFRVPQSSLDEARDRYVAWRASGGPQPPYGSQPPFIGIVPLMTFGKAEANRLYTSETTVNAGTWTRTIQNWAFTCEWINDEAPISESTESREWRFTGEQYDMEPSYIGIDCRQIGTERNLLGICIQLPNYATLAGSFPQQINETRTDKLDWTQPVLYGHCTNNPAVDENGFVLPVRSHTITQIWESMAPFIMGGAPEVFATVVNPNRIYPNFIDTEGGQEVTSDHWHHLLLSFDLEPDCNTQGQIVDNMTDVDRFAGTVESACRMWISYDDVNLVEGALSMYWPQANPDPNAILTPNAYWVFIDVISRDTFSHGTANDRLGNIVSVVDTGAVNLPTCTYTPGLVAAADQPLGIPASAEYIDAILPVELAELQVWAGQTLDTGIIANRRAFVDDAGKSVDPAQAETLIGAKPVILLHGTGHWQKGTNTGPPDVIDPDTGEPAPDPAKALTPTGKIDAYSPDPSLHGPQGPSPSRDSAWR